MRDKDKHCYNCAGYNDSTEGTYCEYRRCTIEDIELVCEDWEPNDETELMMRRDESKADKQRIAELEAENARMRWALGGICNEAVGSDEHQAWVNTGKMVLVETCSEAAKSIEILEIEREQAISDMESWMQAAQEEKAQNAVLRQALSSLTEDVTMEAATLDGRTEQHHLQDSVREAEKMLAETPAQAADRVGALVGALRSIAANTCCGGCQEAAKWARDALEKFEGGGK